MPIIESLIRPCKQGKLYRSKNYVAISETSGGKTWAIYSLSEFAKVHDESRHTLAGLDEDELIDCMTTLEDYQKTTEGAKN